MKQAARPAIFKGRQTEPELILCAVRWDLRYLPRVCGGAVLSAGLLEPLAGPSFHGSSTLNSGVRPRSNALP